MGMCFGRCRHEENDHEVDDDKDAQTNTDDQGTATNGGNQVVEKKHAALHRWLNSNCAPSYPEIQTKQRIGTVNLSNQAGISDFTTDIPTAQTNQYMQFGQRSAEKSIYEQEFDRLARRNNQPSPEAEATVMNDSNGDFREFGYLEQPARTEATDDKTFSYPTSLKVYN